MHNSNFKILLIVLAGILLISGGILRNTKGKSGSNREDTNQQLSNYEGTMLGNNSKVGAILSLLDKNYSWFSLQTKEIPYGLTIYYPNTLSITDQDNFQIASGDKNIISHQKTRSILKKTGILFVLIPNLDIITFDVSDSSTRYQLRFNREEYGKIIGKKPSDYNQNSEAWIQRFDSKDQEDWFNIENYLQEIPNVDEEVIFAWF